MNSSQYEPVRGSTLGKIDLVFLLPFLTFCPGDEVSGANNELVCTIMLCGLSIGSPGLLHVDLHLATPPIRMDMKWQLACVFWSLRH